MPLQLDFSDKSTLFVRATGNVTFAEVQRAFENLVARPSNGGAHEGNGAIDVQVLADARDVTGAPTSEELQTIARELGRLVGRESGSIAIVTESPFAYGIARMFSVFAERFSINVRAFRQMDEARKWLRGSKRSNGVVTDS